MEAADRGLIPSSAFLMLPDWRLRNFAWRMVDCHGAGAFDRAIALAKQRHAEGETIATAMWIAVARHIGFIAAPDRKIVEASNATLSMLEAV